MAHKCADRPLARFVTGPGSWRSTREGAPYELPRRGCRKLAWFGQGTNARVLVPTVVDNHPVGDTPLALDWLRPMMVPGSPPG